ncbi:MAG: hypothetical protein A2Y74_07015 [Actinobacteria bacterium RBG_13_63_9]|nr:MAG: hypothetical protein A2Y74_07015 [Actinobacteria bacterium RBG_13_63_9]
MLNQRRLLSALAADPDFRTACRAAEVKVNTAKKWLVEDEAFQSQYDRLLGPTLKLAKELMESSALKASAVYDEALTATKYGTVEVECPKCHHTFEETSALPDWGTRLRAGEIIHKVAALLIDRRQIQTTRITLTVEEMLAIAAMQAGNQVSPLILSRPHVQEHLRLLTEGEKS